MRDALDQVELADRLGFDYAWEVEHRFLDEYSHSSAPEVFLAAAASRTKPIRLGHGIRQVMELHGFGIPANQERAMALEAAEPIAKMMVLDPHPGYTSGRSPCRTATCCPSRATSRMSVARRCVIHRPLRYRQERAMRIQSIAIGRREAHLKVSVKVSRFQTGRKTKKPQAI